MNYMAMVGFKPEYRPKLIKEVMPESIIEIVCKYFDLPVVKVKRKGRKREIVLCRHLIYFFLKKNGLTLQSIADFFEQDHTTVIHGLQTLKDLCDTQPRLKEKVDELQKIIDEVAYPMVTIGNATL